MRAVLLVSLGCAACDENWFARLEAQETVAATSSALDVFVTIPDHCHKASIAMRGCLDDDGSSYDGPPPEILDVRVACAVFDCNRVELLAPGEQSAAARLRALPASGDTDSLVTLSVRDGNGDIVELSGVYSVRAPDRVDVYACNGTMVPVGSSVIVAPGADIPLSVDTLAGDEFLESRLYEGFTISGAGTLEYQDEILHFLAPATAGELQVVFPDAGRMIRIVTAAIAEQCRIE